MSATHERMYEKAREAINEIFGDTTVDEGQTARSLAALRDEIEMLLDALPDPKEA